jgi:cytochrome c oxidase subunit 2
MLYFFVLAVSSFFSLLIAGLIVYYAVKYRRRTPNSVGVSIHGGMVLEIGWIVIPSLIAVVMFVWGAQTFFHLTRPPKDAMEIYVVGKQWMWKVQHMDGAREINELHVPIGRPVKLIMGSEDVIHSFFIPDYRVKADVIPGRYNTMWFTASKPGRYHIFCTQYCGTKHSNMIGWVTAMDPADYQAWLSGGSSGASMADSGAKLLPGTIDGRFWITLPGCALALVAASAAFVGIEHDGPGATAYVCESILDPQVVAGFQPLMPTYKGLATEEQVRS